MSSSMNSGTPSVLATTSAVISPGKGFVFSDATHQLDGLAGRESIDAHLADIPISRPTIVEVGSAGEQRQYAGGVDVLDQKVEKLDRGRIHPVQVFDYEEDGLPFRPAPKNAQERPHRLLLLLFRRQLIERVCRAPGDR